MKIGIFAKTFQEETLTEKFQTIEKIGYQTIQFNMACLGLDSLPSTISPDLIALTNEEARAHKLEIAGISGTYNMIHPNKRKRNNDFEKFCQLAAASAMLDTNVMSLCTGSRDPQNQWKYHPGNSLPDAWHDLTKELEKALYIAEEQQLTLAIEPELANVVSSIKKAKEILKEMQSSKLKIIFDVANLFELATLREIQYLIDFGIDAFYPDLVMVHAKDKDSSGSFTYPGNGIIPFHYLFERLRKYGYQHSIVAHGFHVDRAIKVHSFLSLL